MECRVYLSLIDACVLSHSVIFSFDQPAAAWGLAKSLPAWPNSNINTTNGDIGPSISMDFFNNSSGVNVIKLDNDRSVLRVRNSIQINAHSGISKVLKASFGETLT